MRLMNVVSRLLLWSKLVKMLNSTRQSIVPLAAENSNKYITLQSLAAGSTFAHFVDTRLFYNPATGVLSVNGIKLTDQPTITNHLPQVVQTYLDSPFTQSVAASVVTDVPGFAATITPRSVKSKIFISVRWFGEIGSTTTWENMWQLKRNGQVLGAVANIGSRIQGMAGTMLSYTASSDASSTPETAHFTYIDSPRTTQACTYQVAHLNNSSLIVHYNKTVSDTAGTSFERGTSTIILMELL
jgi:hypothetical protein